MAPVAEIHLLLFTYLIFSISTFPLSAFCRRWSYDCSTHQTQQVWKACFLKDRTYDLEFPPQTSCLTLSGSTIPFSYKVRNLGVYLDSNLSIDQHVNLLCRSVFLELRRIGHLWRHLSADSTKKLVLSFVLLRLEHSNSRSPGKQAGSLAESTKQCSSPCPWQKAQISPLVVSPSSD